MCLTFWMFFTLGAASSLSFFMAVMGVSLKYGGSPSTISTTMMPRDQISTWKKQDAVKAHLNAPGEVL